MAGALTIETKVPSIPSLPRRLVDLAWSLGTTQHPGQPVRYDLPKAMVLSPEDRREVETLVEQLNSKLDPMASFDPGEGKRAMDAGSAKAMLLTKMIRGLAGAAQPNEVVIAAKMDMYADAVEALPAWAIDLAIKRWACGDCPTSICAEPDFTWPPSPAVLRRLTEDEMDLPRRYAAKFKNLLLAVPVARAMDPTPLPGPAGGPALLPMRRM